MLDDEARRALEQEAIALVNLSNSQPLIKKRPVPTAAEAVMGAKRAHGMTAGVHPLLQQNKATLMARRDDSRAPHPHRVHTTIAATTTTGCRALSHDHPMDERRLSMSVFVNADGRVSLLSGRESPDRHDSFELDPTVMKVDKSVSPTSTATAADSHISMQALLVTLKKRKADDASDATPPSAIKLPRFRDVFDPALKDRSQVPTIQIQTPTVSYTTPTPAPSAPPAIEDAHATEESPYPPPPELKCKYRTGKCGNQRALKSCGDYHNLCNYHRLRANANQRKLDRKKKVQRGQPVGTDSSSEATSPVAAPKLQASQTVSAAASTLVSLPTAFRVPRVAMPPSSGSPFMPYLVPPSAHMGLPSSASPSSLLRPKPETKSC